MPAAAIVTLVLVAILVVALALYLIRIIMILRHTNDQLGKITFGVRAIANQTKPINDLTSSINANLGAVAGALDGFVDEVADTDESAA